MDFDQLLAAASEALNAPPDIVGRSARARATAQGLGPEQILAEWAGVDAGAVSAAPPAAPAAAAAPADAPAPEAAPQLDVEVVAPATEPVPAPEPEPEPEEEPEEVLIGSAGIREMNRKSLPRWLAAMFVVVPLVALFYAATFASGPECGAGGALDVDAATGFPENCDGSEFGSISSPLKLGAALYTADANPSCQSCHGSDGSGGTGPALAGGAVVDTFPACEDHIKWVSLGTNRWRDEEGDTYGANANLVGGGGIMQSYEDAGLTPDEIAAVVLYERVTFGNEDLEAAEAACLASPEAGE